MHRMVLYYKHQEDGKTFNFCFLFLKLFWVNLEKYMSVQILLFKFIHEAAVRIREVDQLVLLHPTHKILIVHFKLIKLCPTLS